MWFASRYGLNKYDSYTITSYYHNPKNKNSLHHNLLNTIFEDSRGNLWAGTNGGGLNLYDRDRDCFIRFLHDENNSHSLADNSIWDVIEDREGVFG